MNVHQKGYQLTGGLNIEFLFDNGIQDGLEKVEFLMGQVHQINK